MIKVKSNLLKFDKYDKNGHIFPKECVITIPKFVPVTNFNSAGPDHFEAIGKVFSYKRDNYRIEIELDIRFKDEELLKKLIEAGEVYSGGYYKINESHRENGALVLDNIELKSVGLYLSDVFGDNDLRMQVIEYDGTGRTLTRSCDKK